jgi:hypothetical protein
VVVTAEGWSDESSEVESSETASSREESSVEVSSDDESSVEESEVDSSDDDPSREEPSSLVELFAEDDELVESEEETFDEVVVEAVNAGSRPAASWM